MAPPPILYIFKIVGDSLHLCGPADSSMKRAKAFEGPGLCIMEPVTGIEKRVVRIGLGRMGHSGLKPKGHFFCSYTYPKHSNDESFPPRHHQLPRQGQLARAGAGMEQDKLTRIGGVPKGPSVGWRFGEGPSGPSLTS